MSVKQKLPIVDTDGNIHFNRMTKAQKNAMNHVAFSGYATDTIPTPKTLKSLCDLELIVKQTRKIGTGWSAVTVGEYSMPMYVHFLWCSQIGEEV